MKDLLVFELKKIIRKKLNIIVILGSLLLTIILFIAPVMQFISFNENGEQVKGFSAIKLEKQRQEEMAGMLTEERITEDILKYQQLFHNPANVVIDDGKKELSESIFSKYVAPKMYYLGFINNTYTLPNLYDYSFSEIKKLPLENGANFYKQRNEKVYKILNASYEDWNYSDKEKNFWIEKSKEVSEPYEYGYHEGWNTIFNCIELMALPIIAICICIASVFAGEYQCGADNIILSSRYGKSKLIIAKILASFIFSFTVYTINILFALGIILLCFGTGGWNLPIQIMNSTIPYALTFLSATIVSLITLYLIMFAMVSITLLLSAKMKTPFSVLIVIICVLIAPFFFKLSETNGIWNHIFMLFPSISCQPVFFLDATNYLSYPLTGFTVDILTMRIIIYMIICMICIPCSYYVFKKHEVV
ncbi:ABC transporter permease [Clostridium tarantellae]|uniref:ABC transporter permease subunit n=1 Tax=Clostridium tarantellae TaxID=39493 RepID=A0A6I1MS89_9CLOT|nr:ABC transporter permease subunit [Clostridium tarantellae]MPQ45057.1 ABC transporter permease subunit [Clostridium tarantellae]